MFSNLCEKCQLCVMKSDDYQSGIFLDTHVSLAPTHVCLSVCLSVILSDFQSVSVSGRLREKLKREGPNYFSILGLGNIS